MHWLLAECEAILKLQEIYIDQEFLYMVLDYQAQGSLLSKILGAIHFSEAQTKLIMT